MDAGYGVVLHPLVERDLTRIAAFLLDYTTTEAVARKLTQVRADIEVLAENPHRGTRHDEIHPGLRAIPSSDKGVVAFEVSDERRLVRVLCVTWAERTGWAGRGSGPRDTGLAPTLAV